MDLIHRRLHFRGVPAGTILASDDFSEADNTNVVGKSLDIGGTWAKVSSAGTALVISGKAQNTDNVAVVVASPDTAYSNVKISANITTAYTGYGAGLIARWNGATHVASTSGTYIKGDLLVGTSIRIISYVDGVTTIITANTSLQPNINTEYSCSLTVDGSTATFVTPLGTITGTIPSYSYNRHGFQLFSVSSYNAKVDNWKVETI